jgi:hypothetical protein
LISDWIPRNKERITLTLLLIIPAVIALLYIFLFGRTVLFWDEWVMVPVIDQFLNGNIPWQVLFGQVNEHVMVFPKLAIVGIALITGYNTVAEMYSSWIMLVLITLLVLTLYIRYLGKTRNSLLLFIPVAWLLWSLRQWENFLFGFQLNFFLCILGFVIAVVLLDRSEDISLSFIGALGGAVVTSFSILNGLLIWPIGILQILLQRKGKKMLISWVVSSLVISSLYFLTWTRSDNLPAMTFFSNDPAGAIKYFFAFVGSPVSSGPWAEILIVYSVLAGFFITLFTIAGIVLTVKHNLIKENSPWIALMLFSLGTALMTTIGRGGLGIAQALSSRYVTFTIPGIIGLYLLSVSLYRHKCPDVISSGWMLKGITCIILFGVFLGMIEGTALGMKIASDREKMTCTLLNYSSASDDALLALHPDAGFTREMAKVLERRHINVFSRPDNQQQNINCTTAGTYPDLYYQLFAYKEKITQRISGT